MAADATNGAIPITLERRERDDAPVGAGSTASTSRAVVQVHPDDSVAVVVSARIAATS